MKMISLKIYNQKQEVAGKFARIRVGTKRYVLYLNGCYGMFYITKLD